MKSITKNEFLRGFKQDFDGDEENGYVYKTFSISFDHFKTVCDQAFASLTELTQILENPDEYQGLLIEINNSMLSHIFGDGKSFQGSFEE